MLLVILLKGESEEAYNIANEEQEISIKEFVEKLAEISKVKVNFNIEVNQEKGYSKVKNTILNNNKLKALGWIPLYSTKESLTNVLQILKLEEK